jgi:Prenyltransferase and squalene oxidase repeat
VKHTAIALCLLLLAAPARGEDEPVDPFDASVSAAIAKGVAYLTKDRKSDGSWAGDEGHTALALLALHRSGVRRGTPVFDRGLAWLLARRKGLGTYATSMTIMVLVEDSPTKHRKIIRRLALNLVLAQCSNGQWSYKVQPGRVRKQGDNSNTQFALLGLWMSRHAGVVVPRHVWTRAKGHFESTQNEDGGWGYSHNQRRDSYGSMTAAGAACVAITTSGLMIEDVKLTHVAGDPVIRRARAWLGREFRVDRNPKVARKVGGRQRARPANPIVSTYKRYYYLWSLERTGRLMGLEKFGEHDWYREGAKALLGEQKDNGRWIGSKPLTGTCFALLFLTRGTKPVTTKPVTGAEVTPR